MDGYGPERIGVDRVYQVDVDEVAAQNYQVAAVDVFDVLLGDYVVVCALDLQFIGFHEVFRTQDGQVFAQCHIIDVCEVLRVYLPQDIDIMLDYVLQNACSYH